jgi:hypothetical protein
MGRTTCAIAAALFAMAARAPAHHAFASEYDEHKVVTVSGIVTKFEWTNPHASLYVDGRDETGKTGTWRFEMGSPGGLQRRGWKRSDVKEGDAITIDGFAAKDGSNLANARNVTLPDGRRLFGGFASTPGAPGK